MSLQHACRLQIILSLRIYICFLTTSVKSVMITDKEEKKDKNFSLQLLKSSLNFYKEISIKENNLNFIFPNFFLNWYL